MSLEGWIFNIQRYSLQDGPGIRTTVFLKGCPLRCLWCHNPEGLEPHPQLRLTRNLCTHCRACEAACSQDVHKVTPEKHLMQIDRCLQCGRCVESCSFGALEMVGQLMSVEDVLTVVRRDLPFYTTSNGGMTLSGGEPLAQFAFAQALLSAAKAEGLHTAIETSSFTPWERLESLLPVVDLFLIDLKHIDDGRHRALTGVSNTRILANIRQMVARSHPLLLRIPWVPTLNAEGAFLDALEIFLKEFRTPPPVEFMPYHRLGQGKWTALGGMSDMPDDIPDATGEDITPWVDRLRSAGISVSYAGGNL